MRKYSIFAFCGVVMIIAFFVFGVNSPATEPAHPEKQVVIEAPPKSLDQYYPPQAKEPVYLMEMIELAILYNSTSHDVFQKDWENAFRGFASFKEQMIKLSKR